MMVEVEVAAEVAAAAAAAAGRSSLYPSKGWNDGVVQRAYCQPEQPPHSGNAATWCGVTTAALLVCTTRRLASRTLTLNLPHSSLHALGSHTHPPPLAHPPSLPLGSSSRYSTTPPPPVRRLETEAEPKHQQPVTSHTTGMEFLNLSSSPSPSLVEGPSGHESTSLLVNPPSPSMSASYQAYSFGGDTPTDPNPHETANLPWATGNNSMIDEDARFVNDQAERRAIREQVIELQEPVWPASGTEELATMQVASDTAVDTSFSHDESTTLNRSFSQRMSDLLKTPTWTQRTSATSDYAQYDHDKDSIVGFRGGDWEQVSEDDWAQADEEEFRGVPPSSEVRASVPEGDDPSLYSNTVRAWFLIILFISIAAAFNTLMMVTSSVGFMEGPCIQLFSFFVAKGLERAPYPEHWPGSKWVNPGKFNIKEHAYVYPGNTLLFRAAGMETDSAS